MNALINLNLIIQLTLVVIVFYAAYLAKKGWMERHCSVMRIAVIVQILSIAVVMLPKMVGYVGNLQATSSLSIEMWVHHLAGLAVVGLWVFMNLAMTGRIKIKGRLRPYMRLALIFWLVSLGLGIHIYASVWGWPWA